MAEAVVTGGSGFIGGRLIERLRSDGHVVRALARSDQAAERIRKRHGEPVPGDLDDVSAMRAGADGCDWAFHAAAMVGDWPESHASAQVSCAAPRKRPRSSQSWTRAFDATPPL